MSAFVPGLSLASSRSFATGDSKISVTKRTATTSVTPLTEISAIKLPSLPSLPSIPNPLGSGKKKEAPAPPPQPKAPARPIQSSVVVSTSPTPPKATPEPKASSGGAFPDGLPKFYNPSTANYEFKANAKGQGATAFDVRKGVEKNTTNQRINEQGGFRNMDPYTEPLVWARPGWSSDEARVGVRVALRNVLGNAHLFDSELAELDTSISCVTETADMKEFVRAIGLSSAYRTRFFEGTSNMRFIECNFLHFLGRAPLNQEEVAEHIKIINEQGYNAEINSYVDSDEYDTLFGNSRIPAPNFRGGHQYNNGMNKLAVLAGGYSTTDRIVKAAFLTTGDSSNFSPASILRGLPEAWRGENTTRDVAGPIYSFPSDVFWNTQPIGLREAEIAWIAKYGNWTQFWYKDSSVFKEVMKPMMTSTVEEEEEAAAILKYGSTMANAYVGCRWAYDVAPVIEIRPPTNAETANGFLSVAMKEISFSIPGSLEQSI